MEIAAETERLTKLEMAATKTAQASTRAHKSLDYETKDFSSAEVAAIVPGHVTRGDSTYAQQKVLYDKYIAYREGRGPFANVAAPPGHSDHETGHALDLTGTNVAAVRKAANDAHIPIKQLFWEVDHVHFAWKAVGDETNKATRELEQQVKIAETRKLNEDGFWQTLDNEAKVASMLPGDAEKYRKELELQKIRADGVLANVKELSFVDKMRISLAVDLKNLEKDRAAVEGASKNALIEQAKLLGQQAALQGDTNDQIEEQLAIEQRLWPYKQKFLEDGLSLQDATVQKALAELAAREKTNYEIERRNRLIQEGNSLVDDMLNERDPGRKVQVDYRKNLERLGASTRPQEQKDKALEQLNRDFANDMNKVQAKFFQDMMSHVHDIGEAFGGAFGKALDAVGSMAVIFTQMSQKFYQAGTVGAQADNPVSKTLSGFQGVSNNLQAIFGTAGNVKGSQFFQGLSKVLGQASDGAAMGQQVAGIAKALGFKKFSSTGSEIGGAAGSIIGTAVGGPVGGMIGGFLGSLQGGIIGSLFKKTKQGGVTLTGMGDLSTFGNSSKAIQAASAAASSIQQGLQNIATTLGGSVGSFNLTFGQRHGDYRVNTTGTSLKVDKGAKDFNDDQQAAIAYAILQAIKQGALKGLSEATSRVLRAGNENNIDQLVQAAQVYENLVKLAAAAANPASAAFSAFITGMQNTMQMLKAAGYTYDELAKLSDAFAEQQKQVLAEMTQGYKDFLNEITNGPSSGKTVFDQFIAAQKSFQDLLASHSYTQDQFTESGQTYLDLARQVYGSATPQFEQVRQSLVDATQKAIDDATKAAQDAMNSAGIISAIGDTNSILTAILNHMFGRDTSPTGTTTTPPSGYSVSGGDPYGSGSDSTYAGSNYSGLSGGGASSLLDKQYIQAL
jgi:hypothetical protein